MNLFAVLGFYLLTLYQRQLTDFDLKMKVNSEWIRSLLGRNEEVVVKAERDP